MLNLLVILFLREKRSVFINRYTFPLRLIASLINILFYYYTAKAFQPNAAFFTEGGHWNLFQFVMIGELSLGILLDSLIIYPQKLRQIINEGAFDSLMLTKAGVLKPLLHMGMTSLLIGTTTLVFNLFVLFLFFEFPIHVMGLLKALLLNLAFLPLFTGLGIVAAAFLIYFRRGCNILGTIAGSLSILSGAYFPTDVFPQLIVQINNYINPLQFLLIENRELLATGNSTHIFPLQILFILLAGALSLLAGKGLFYFALMNYKRRGGVLILGAS